MPERVIGWAFALVIFIVLLVVLLKVVDVL